MTNRTDKPGAQVGPSTYNGDPQTAGAPETAAGAPHMRILVSTYAILWLSITSEVSCCSQWERVHRWTR